MPTSLPADVSFNKVTQTLSSFTFFCIWFALAMLSYYFVDIPLANYFNYQADILWIMIADWVTLLGSGAVDIIAVLLFYFIIRNPIKNKAARQELIFILAAFVCVSLLCTLLKFGLGRARPMMFINENLFGFYFFQFDSIMKSFPSGHASTISCILISLSFFYPRYWKIALLLVLIVSFSRVVNSAHYLSDVLAGLYLGTFIPIKLKALLEKRARFYMPVSNP